MLSQNRANNLRDIFRDCRFKSIQHHCFFMQLTMVGILSFNLLILQKECIVAQQNQQGEIDEAF